MKHVDLLVHSAGQLLTLAGGPQRGRELGRLGLIEDGAVAVADGRILAVGTSADLRRTYQATREIDAGGRVVLPGFVDPHTHVVWVGDRAAEFEMRIAGATYLEILAAGGGIVSTVQRTRAASVEQLMAETRPRLERMLRHGTTTVEAKSGYGLETVAELRMLEAILRLDQAGPVRLAPTFLGAHAVPPEYKGRTDAYVELVCDEMLPQVGAWWSQHALGRKLPFVDVFCEEGAFNLEQSRRMLERARALGFPLKIHADEFVGLGRDRPGGRAGGCLGGPPRAYAAGCYRQAWRRNDGRRRSALHSVRTSRRPRTRRPAPSLTPEGFLRWPPISTPGRLGAKACSSRWPSRVVTWG